MRALKGSQCEKDGQGAGHDAPKVAGLLLAAGASTRMGVMKQLLPAREGTILEMLLDEALGSTLDTVVLVLGYGAEKIKKSIGMSLVHPKLRVIENRHYETGISSSIKAGLSEVEESHGHVMILLADMPHIDSRIINLLLRRYLDSRLPLGAIQIRGRRSHPVIFSREMYAGLKALQGDTGARDLFLRHGNRVCLVEPNGNYDDRDIDTIKDYRRFQEFLLGPGTEGI